MSALRCLPLLRRSTLAAAVLHCTACKKSMQSMQCIRTSLGVSDSWSDLECIHPPQTYHEDTSSLPDRTIKEKPSLAFRAKFSNGIRDTPRDTPRNSSCSPSSILSAATPTPSNHILRALMIAIDTRTHRSALDSFMRVDRHYPEVLANLPELYFKQIIDILVFNGKDIARRMTPPDRLNYAAHVLECMKKHNVLPSFNLLKTAIYIYGHLRDLNSVDRVYAYIIQKGFDLHDPRLLTNMCRAYILNGQDEKGIAYFKRQHIRYHTQSAYNSLIGVYVDLNDHPGVFSALNLMQNAKIPANADTIAMICKLYLAQNDLDTVCKHIEMFKSKGGVLESNMYHIQIRVCNARGEHQAVLDNIREMKASNVEISRKTLRYVITAYAHLGDVQRMLGVYRISAPTSSSSIESHTAMAMAFGPLLSSDAVSDIKIRAVYSSVSPITLLYDLVRGYQQLGDVVSVKLLLDDLEKAESRFSPSWYNFVILAYHVAKDADGAWSYAQVLADKYQNNVSPGVWRSVIRTVSLYKPQMLDGVVAYIKSRYKEFPIEDALASV
ncbi:hypothetical protein BASA50_000165 [Batrachochytrium salamandrivorans]|uniref:Pentatricopeptide repeat-containing protein-mitochondrial domain-containing protein n=1 Tax=Batrachochytrium salamandrivorans TaxID=1357716 RepID=A0ABQ8EX06_9FUNG|nr:hypothetical protein BASA62_001586 [Batrachochytrium salamandrivorans]KAH6586800.1 hypothetical protein BASA50_000165 [Batrachochytrium salamandrivorans]KAH9264297.1 hypothetical protein BASA83_012252 [Batrachochytrium salamandrivorans]